MPTIFDLLQPKTTSTQPLTALDSQLLNVPQEMIGYGPVIPTATTTTDALNTNQNNTLIDQSLMGPFIGGIPNAQQAIPTPGATLTPAPQPVGGLTATQPTTTQAGTSILGKQAEVVGNTMYTSDGRVINNPIVSDYEAYGLTAPQGTPTVSPKNTFSGLLFGPYGGQSLARTETSAADAPTQTPTYLGALGGIRNAAPINQFAAFNRDANYEQPYLSYGGDIILPGGGVINNPTQADYLQYGITADRPFEKGAYEKTESNVVNELKMAKDSALKFVNEQIAANNLSPEDAKALRNAVSQEWDDKIQNYRGLANLPGSQQFAGFYNRTPEQYLNNIPESDRSFRPTAQNIYDSLSATEKASVDINKIQSWLNANPDFKINLTPDLIQKAAQRGDINLGTKLIGWDYDKLAVTDPEQLKALNAAGNNYALGLNMLNDWGLLQASKQGRTSTGFGVHRAAQMAQAVADGTLTSDGKFTADELKQYMPGTSSRARSQLANFMNDMRALRGDDEITLDDLRRITPGGTAPKLVDPENDIYTVSAVKYKKGDHYIVVQKTGDDQYRVVGGTKQFTPTGGGGFWNWAPLIAGVALSFLSPTFAGSIGSAITGSGTSALSSQVLGNAILGALKSGLMGGDVLTGALTGGIGSGVSGLTQGFLGDINIAGLPLKSNIINSIAGAAGNLATTPITGQQIDPSALLTNIAISGIAPSISSEIQSALPSGLSPNVSSAISSGLTYGGLNSLTGATPPNLLTQLGTTAGIIPNTPLTSAVSGAISGYRNP